MITANMKPITDVLSKEKHLSTVKGQFRGYFETASSHPVECFEKKGTEIEKLLKDTIGDMNPKDFKQTINDSALGRLNTYLGMLRTFVSEEMDERVSGEDCIHDRVAFAGANWKPLLVLRDKWAAAASTWVQQHNQLKRAYDNEKNAQSAAEKRAAEMGPAGAPGHKRMRVRSAQVAKDRNPGSITVNEGALCTFVEPCLNPMWSMVKMDDGRTGKVSASRLEAIAEEMEPDPSDDEADAPAEAVQPPAEADAQVDSAEAYEVDHGQEMADWLPASPEAHATSTTDLDLTPGRPGAPIIIDAQAIGAWTSHGHLKFAPLIAGVHSGDTLWWDNGTIYKLQDGRTVRLCDA